VFISVRAFVGLHSIVVFVGLYVSFICYSDLCLALLSVKTASDTCMYELSFLLMISILSIGYNTVWGVLCECNEHNTLQTVL